ncbi:hypothetical protein ACN077_24505 [Clostridium chromiireducens]|uniref:hypothetical protein n=1 Tax=Clostridium chromiireducens TaxID=225345 RepID=UPI003AF4CAAE
MDITAETGLRRGELCGSDIDKHIDTKKQTLIVRQALIRVKNSYVLSQRLKTESFYRTLQISELLYIKIENHKKLLKLKKFNIENFI